VSHKTQQACNVLLELKCGGLLLDRHEPPFTRRFVVYFRTALYTHQALVNQEPHPPLSRVLRGKDFLPLAFFPFQGRLGHARMYNGAMAIISLFRVG
jgi:hypothetical protein